MMLGLESLTATDDAGAGEPLSIFAFLEVSWRPFSIHEVDGGTVVFLFLVLADLVHKISTLARLQV